MKKRLRIQRWLAMLLAVAMVLTACGSGGNTSSTPASTPEAASETAASSEETPKLTPAYSTEGFETVDADGNRIVTGRDATGKEEMAVASKYEVSQVGAEIMEKGGNAVDAAVAMSFALGVVEPFSNGMGGGGIATIHTADGKDTFIDFREVAPKGATLDLYVDAEGKSNTNNMNGGLASGVPGLVDGMLYMLDKYGTMDRAEVLAPAIKIASQGFVVSQYFANVISDAFETAQKFPEMQSVYFSPEGLPWQVGDVINNPKMAETLQAIADQGRDGFYTGDVAQAIVDSVKEYDGVMTMDDLANYHAQELAPVTGEYRGYQVISSPPPSSGGTHLIEILNIMENFDIGSMKINSPEYIHTLTEAFKLAFADRARYMADTAFTEVPLNGLTSQEYADERAKLIDPAKAQEEAVEGDPTVFEHTDTSHFSVADKAGNLVAVTQTINGYFGSGVMVKGHGFMMNNQMGDFSTDAKSVNKIEPGKKPLSSMSPTIVLDKEGKPFLITGTPGGTKIFEGIVQGISRVIDHQLPLLDAVSIPKFWNTSNKDKITYEAPLKGYEEYAITPETIKALTDMGHKEPEVQSSGAMQSIMFMPDGSLYGVGDPRQDGKAVGK